MYKVWKFVYEELGTRHYKKTVELVKSGITFSEAKSLRDLDRSLEISRCGESND